MRDGAQIDLLEAQLTETDFDAPDRAQAQAIIDDLRAALAIQADPSVLDPATAGRLEDVAKRIDRLTADLADPGYPGPADEAQRAEAMAQPGWGEGNVELPPLPMTERGRKFDAASAVMTGIAEDFQNIRNESPTLTAGLQALRARYRSFEVDQSGGPEVVEQREDLIKQIDKIFKRIDDGRIFPVEITQPVEDAMVDLQREIVRQQGSLRYIDALAMPGGRIEAGNLGCSEQGSGRWLPKPSDTVATFLWMADPGVGYKGFPAALVQDETGVGDDRVRRTGLDRQADSRRVPAPR